MPAQSRYRRASGQRVRIRVSESGQGAVMVASDFVADAVGMRLLALLFVLIPVLFVKAAPVFAGAPDAGELAVAGPIGAGSRHRDVLRNGLSPMRRPAYRGLPSVPRWYRPGAYRPRPQTDRPGNADADGLRDVG